MAHNELASRTAELDLVDDMEYHRRAWALQRAAWIGALVLLAAALVGLWGDGDLLNVGRAGDGSSPLQQDDDRLSQRRINIPLTAEIDDGARTENLIRFWLSRDYLNRYDVRSILPEPEAVEIDDERPVYTLAVAKPSDSYQITFRLVSSRAGLDRGEAGVVGQKVSFSQLIYP